MEKLNLKYIEFISHTQKKIDKKVKQEVCKSIFVVFIFTDPASMRFQRNPSLCKRALKTVIKLDLDPMAPPSTLQVVSTLPPFPTPLSTPPPPLFSQVSLRGSLTARPAEVSPRPPTLH